MNRRRLLIPALLIGLALPAGAQEISNLEANRPISIEDANPITPDALSASVDYAFARRLDGVNYNGPALALVYGVLPNAEAGVETRLLTNPHSNAARGIGSADLDLHVLGRIAPETSDRPAIAVRADVFLPTGLASHGTNLSAEILATRTFSTFRLHINAGGLYVGDTREDERRNRLFAIAGADFSPLGPWRTDTLIVADTYIRQSVRTDGHPAAGAEIGLRQRIGIQTLAYTGLGTEFAGEADRTRYRVLVGVTHAF